MDPEEIKVGETYNVRMNFQRIDEDGDFCFRVFGGDGAVRFLKPTQVERAVFPLSDPADGTKNTEKEAIFPTIKKLATLPPNFPHPETVKKYDPCRPFKVGDEVRYCVPDGRIYADRGSLIEHIKNRDFTRVIRDELSNGRVGVFDPFDEENPYYVPAHALELVTPVEELEPYLVEKSGNGYRLMKRNGKLLANYWKTHPHAKEAAEAERDRLNAEFGQRINETTKTQTTESK